MRLIDADELKIYISTTFCDTCKRDKGVCSSCEFDDVFVAIDNAPTIDIAEVCGECKPYTPCIYCKHDFENKFETCGAKMDKGGDTEGFGFHYADHECEYDFMPVVRCKDCDRGFGSPVCPIQSKGWAINKDTFFCAWGGRREP